MAYREFEDEAGRPWRVWDVYPTRAERREREDRRDGDRTGRGRRRSEELRVAVRPELLDGWLCFEAAGERRRLIPVPDGWADAPVPRLVEWLACAATAPLRRLIE